MQVSFNGPVDAQWRSSLFERDLNTMIASRVGADTASGDALLERRSLSRQRSTTPTRRYGGFRRSLSRCSSSASLGLRILTRPK